MVKLLHAFRASPRASKWGVQDFLYQIHLLGHPNGYYNPFPVT